MNGRNFAAVPEFPAPANGRRYKWGNWHLSLPSLDRAILAFPRDTKCPQGEVLVVTSRSKICGLFSFASLTLIARAAVGSIGLLPEKVYSRQKKQGHFPNSKVDIFLKIA